MARIVCQVLHRADRITFIWSEGAASFEPYHLEGAERANLLQVADQIHAKLAAVPATELVPLGQQLYRAVMGTAGAGAVQTWLSQLVGSNSIEKLEFLSDAPGLIPWNTLIEEGGAGFWGERFSLGAGRRVNALRQNPAQGQPNLRFAADLDLVNQLSPDQQAQLAPLRTEGKLVHTVASLEDDLKRLAPDVFLLLVRCVQGQLRLGADTFRISDLQSWLEEPKEGNPDPLVILMGCGDVTDQSAWRGLLCAASTSFSGLVANEVLLSAGQVFEVGHALARRFAEGKQSLGEILQALRKEQGAAALAFSAFCPPQVRVVAEGATAPTAELPVESVPLPRLPYRPFAAFDVEDRALLFGREEDVLRGALTIDHADAVGVLLHGSPAVGKTSYLQAGLLPYLEQESIGYRVLRDRTPFESPKAEKDYPVLILRCTGDLTGQFADALSAFCAQPFVYTTPAGTQVSVDLPKIMQQTLPGAMPATRSSTAIQSVPASPDGRSSQVAPTGNSIDWRRDPRLQGRFNPEHPEDVQVLVHDGGPRITDRRPELVWVRVLACDGDVFTGEVLNQPSQLETVKQGSRVQFLVPVGGEHPLQARPKYLSERSDWIISPCNRCGLSELFDAPSDLIRKVFPNMPPDGTPETFTAFCGACGGTQVVRHKNFEDAHQDENEPSTTDGDQGALARDLWIALRDNKHLLAKLLDVITRQLPFELIIAVDQGEELLTLVRTTQQQSRRQKAIDMLMHLSCIAPRCKIVFTIRSQSLGQLCSLLPDGQAPADWRSFALRPLSETELADALLWPTNREEIPYCGEVPFQKYGFVFEDGMAAQLVTEALDASASELQSPLPMLQAVGALLYDRQIVEKKQKTLHAIDVKDLGGMKNAFGKYLERTLEKLPISKPSRQALRDLTSKLYTGHADGTLSRDLVPASELKSQWNAQAEPIEPIVNQAAEEHGLFEIQQLLIGGRSDTYVSLPQDSLAQFGKKVADEREQRAYARTKVMDLLWIMIPLMFLFTTMAFAGTRYYSNMRIGELQEIIDKEREEQKSFVKEANDFIKERDAQTKRLNRPLQYVGLLAQADQALRADNSLRARQLLLSQPAMRSYLEVQKESLMPDLRGFDWKYLWRYLNSERHLLEGHRGIVTSVAISTDNKHAASASIDGTVRVWNLANGEILAMIPAGKTPVHAVAFAPDGKTLASAGADKIVRLWDLSDLKTDYVEITKEKSTFAGHEAAIHALAFGKDADTLASAGADKLVIVWDKGKEKYRFKDHAAAVHALAFSTDGKTLVSAGDKAQFFIYDADAGKKLFDGKTAYQSIAALSMSSDGKTFATGGVETRLDVDLGVVRFWNLADAKETLKPITYSTGVLALAFAPDGKSIASSGKDHLVRLWNVQTGEQKRKWIGHLGAINSLAFARDDSALVSGSFDASVKVWNPAQSSGPDVIDAHGDWVQALALNPKNTLLASGARDGSVKLWDPKTGKFIKALPPHQGAVTSLAFSNHQDKEPTLLAVGTRDDKDKGAIKIWQIDVDPKQDVAAKELHTFTAHTKGVTCLDFNPKADKADMLISGSADQTVKVWDCKTGKEMASHHGHKDEVRCLAFIDGGVFASGGKDALVCVYEPDGKDIRKIPDLHLGSIEAIALFKIPSVTDPHEEFAGILTGSTDQSMRVSIVNQRFGNEKSTKIADHYRSHALPISALVHQKSPSNDSALVASASWDGTIKLYGRTTLFDPLQERFTLVGHHGAVRALAMASDQSFVASAGNDGTIRIWRAHQERAAVKKDK